MGLAIDTIGSYYTNGTTVAATLQDCTASAGDSLTVKNFQGSAKATLENVFYQGATSDLARVKAPRFADNVTGITYAPGSSPSQFLLPAVTGQPLYSGELITTQAGAAAGASAIVGLGVYYTDLPGINARFHSWGDISGIIANIKSVEVDITTSGTIGTWEDTLITTTEDQLHADTDYAILGYQCQTAVACVAVKGVMTGNLRVGGPGPVTTLEISEYFVYMSNRTMTPHIPVFNANNKSNVYVSTLANTASVTTKVVLNLAQLTHTITP